MYKSNFQLWTLNFNLLLMLYLLEKHPLKESYLNIFFLLTRCGNSCLSFFPSLWNIFQWYCFWSILRLSGYASSCKPICLCQGPWPGQRGCLGSPMGCFSAVFALCAQAQLAMSLHKPGRMALAQRKPNRELSPQEARSLGLWPCHHEQALACPRPLSVGPGVWASWGEARQPESGTASLCQLLNPLGQHRAGTLVRTCFTCGADRVDARMGCSLVLPQPCSECGQGLGWVLHGALSTWRPVPARCFHHFWQRRPQHHSLLLRLQQALVGWLETSIATEGPHHSLLPWAGIVLLYHVCCVPLPTVGGPVAPGAVETP